MRKVNLKDLKEDDWQSPGGKYAARFKGISEALGRDPDSSDLAKRHPFDLELTTVPPGKLMCPYHSHSAQWEIYLVVAGKGNVRHKDGKTEVVAGDAFIFAPNEPHQLSNLGTEDLSITWSPIIPLANRVTTRIAVNGKSTSDLRPIGS